MKRLYSPCVILVLLCLTSCHFVNEIFKVWAVGGIFTIVVIVCLIWIVSMLRK
jgi:hypothetical protein